jgi:hypothetical protein
MKIAIIIPDLTRNGPIIYVEYLVESLLKLNIDIDIYCLNHNSNFRLEKVKLININFFSSINYDQYDIVHSHTIKADLFALKNGAKIKDKWIITLHNLYKIDLGLLYTPVKSRFITRIWDLAFKSCKNYIVFSSSMKKYYLKEIGNKNYNVIRTGVPVSLGNNLIDDDRELLENLERKYIILGSAGHLIKRKGYHQLVELLTRNKKYVVVIIGEGSEREELLSMAKLLCVDDRLFLLGFKNNPIDYYKYFDVFVLPSYAEGLPLSLLEALGSGLPIVCSKLENYLDHFSEDDVCYFELDNISSLEFSVNKAHFQREHLSKVSKNNYDKKFSSEIMAIKHLQFYESIISQ